MQNLHCRFVYYLVPVKSMVEISQNFVAFSEYMNFTKLMVPQVQLYTATVLSSQKPELNFVVLLIPKRGVNLQIHISLVSNGHLYDVREVVNIFKRRFEISNK